MTVSESKGLKKGARVYWRGDAADSGVVSETSWSAVTIHGTMGKMASCEMQRPVSFLRRPDICSGDQRWWILSITYARMVSDYAPTQERLDRLQGLVGGAGCPTLLDS